MQHIEKITTIYGFLIYLNYLNDFLNYLHVHTFLPWSSEDFVKYVYLLCTMHTGSAVG